MSGFSSEIVIGIDFGTTHSGVSWAVNGGQKTVRLINNWPNPEARNATSDKVPSVISYKNGKVDKWGYNVRANDESFRWFKILLEPDSKYTKMVEWVKKSNELLTKLGKTVVDVVSDYLREIWKYTLDDIQKRQGDDFRDIYALKVVITVPAVWTEAAKKRTEQAAKQAGLPDDIAMVTEPEAAALATLKDKSESDELAVNDCFVVCDAGGGTVDLISYKVLKLEPLEIKEAVIGSGDLCGSVFVDIGFQKWVTTQVGERNFAGLREAARKEMLKNFEYQVKRGFDPNQPEYGVELRGVDDLNTSLDTTDDVITVKSSTVKTVFDHVCLQIDNLVEKQVTQVRDKNDKVKAILLVGGFGESGYLYDILKNSYKRDTTRVLQVTGAWSSICRGATMWGLEHSDLIVTAKKTVKSRLARYSIGFPIGEIWNPSIHIEADKYLDRAEGIFRATGQMKWLSRRGEEIDEESVVNTEVYESVQVGWLDQGTRSFSCPLYYCEDDAPPRRLKAPSVKKLVDVDYAIDCTKLWVHGKSYKSPVTREKWRNANFDIFVQLGAAKLEFLVMFKGEVAAMVEAKYPDV